MTARIVAIVGTDTGVGKTVVTTGLIGALLHDSISVDACKPIASGVEAGSAGEDAALIAAALGRTAADYALLTFVAPRSPKAAAAAEGRRINVDSLATTIRQRAEAANTDFLLVEGVGGVLVPLDDDHTVLDLVRSLGAPTIVVGRAGLGTINHTALTIRACRDAGVRVTGVILSALEPIDPLFAKENAEQIAQQCDIAVVGVLSFIEDPRDPVVLAGAVHALPGYQHLVRELQTIPSTARVVDADHRHVWHPFTQTTEWLEESPLVIERGEGSWLIDADGKRYLDGVASLWANVHGHAHPRLDRAVREQMGRVAHSTFLGQTHAPGALLAEELTAVLPDALTRVFYGESGASSVEVALRFALLAQRYRGQEQRIKFVSLQDSYHGDTAGAVSVGFSETFHRGLNPLLFDALRVPPPQLVGEEASLAAMRKTFAEHGNSVAALILEPRMQGAAGMWPHSDSWLREATSIAHNHGAIVICDEVATGFGRTGDLFANKGAGIMPDIVCLGKGLTGGYLPLSATVTTEELFDLFSAPYAEHRTLYYGHTYAANPMACAAARESLRIFQDDDVMSHARRLADTLARLLREVADFDSVREVRQRGVMVGIELAQPDGTAFSADSRIGRQVTLAARERGVIIRPLGDVVVLNPPLCLTEAEVDVLVSAVEESIVAVTQRVAMLA